MTTYATNALLGLSVFLAAFSAAGAESTKKATDFEQEVYFLEISGVMTIDEQRTTDYMVYLFEDGTLRDSFYIDNRREQYFGLEFEHNYALKFVKEGYRNRVLLIDTHLPDEAYASIFTFRYSIEFISKDAPPNTFDDFPVAFVTYDSKLKDFDYNKTYHNNVRFNAGKATGQTVLGGKRTATDVE